MIGPPPERSDLSARPASDHGRFEIANTRLIALTSRRSRWASCKYRLRRGRASWEPCLTRCVWLPGVLSSDMFAVTGHDWPGGHFPALAWFADNVHYVK